MLLLAEMCKATRENLGIKQTQVAIETGYSEQNISSFENGRTNNMIIFLWYIQHGLLSDPDNASMVNYLKEVY